MIFFLLVLVHAGVRKIWASHSNIWAAEYWLTQNRRASQLRAHLLGVEFFVEHLMQVGLYFKLF